MLLRHFIWKLFVILFAFMDYSVDEYNNEPYYYY